jgi:hypothetical protein
LGTAGDAFAPVLVECDGKSDRNSFAIFGRIRCSGAARDMAEAAWDERATRQNSIMRKAAASLELVVISTSFGLE